MVACATVSRPGDKARRGFRCPDHGRQPSGARDGRILSRGFNASKLQCVSMVEWFSVEENTTVGIWRSKVGCWALRECLWLPKTTALERSLSASAHGQGSRAQRSY